MRIEFISTKSAYSLVERFHYSKTKPRLTKCCLGGFDKGKLVGVMSLGWGVQPKATIKKLFPSLDTKDYYEIGKLCMDDGMPRNSESIFISQCFKKIKKHFSIKLIFTWSDGMLGKPGYVYQASNFLYGGYIWTDAYFTLDGKKIHPRSTRELCKLNAKELGKDRVFWLSDDFQEKYGIYRYKGKQFRYVYFLCHRKQKKRLLEESSVVWGLNHPKEDDLEWKRKTGGKWVLCEPPLYVKSLSASDVSKEIPLISNHTSPIPILINQTTLD